MAFHLCSICQEDGSVLVKSVEVAVEETEEGGGRTWYGTITATHLTALTAGQRYRLVLDDGRSGEFLVRRTTFAGGVNWAVSIHGTGALG